MNERPRDRADELLDAMFQDAARRDAVLPYQDEDSTDLSGWVLVKAVWQGQVHECEKRIPPELATLFKHHVLDKAIWDASVQVRRSLVKQRYPNTVLDGRVPIRDGTAQIAAIEAYLAQAGNRYLALTPPSAMAGLTKWRAEFACLHPGSGMEVARHSPCGYGDNSSVAIENLLRFVELREPIDG